jgi:hypothetical protein
MMRAMDDLTGAAPGVIATTALTMMITMVAADAVIATTTIIIVAAADVTVTTMIITAAAVVVIAMTLTSMVADAGATFFNVLPSVSYSEDDCSGRADSA